MYFIRRCDFLNVLKKYIMYL
jgi:hypothetical protein